MSSNLDMMLAIRSQSIELEARAESSFQRRNQSIYELSFLSIWELQSHVAAIALISLVAFAPFWATLVVMITWSLTATLVYHHVRRKGLPDLFETRWSKPPAALRQWKDWIACTSLSLVKACVAGLQPFLFCRVACGVLSRPAVSRRMRLARGMVLGLGLTLFGVTAAHHLLRRSGLPDDRILRLSLLGPFLNVPYRMVISAVVINALFGWSPAVPI
jgi:hypothetical protein